MFGLLRRRVGQGHFFLPRLGPTGCRSCTTLWQSSVCGPLPAARPRSAGISRPKCPSSSLHASSTRVIQIFTKLTQICSVVCCQATSCNHLTHSAIAFRFMPQNEGPGWCYSEVKFVCAQGQCSFLEGCSLCCLLSGLYQAGERFWRLHSKARGTASAVAVSAGFCPAVARLWDLNTELPKHTCKGCLAAQRMIRLLKLVPQIWASLPRTPELGSCGGVVARWLQAGFGDLAAL